MTFTKPRFSALVSFFHSPQESRLHSALRFSEIFLSNSLLLNLRSNPLVYRSSLSSQGYHSHRGPWCLTLFPAQKAEEAPKPTCFEYSPDCAPPQPSGPCSLFPPQPWVVSSVRVKRDGKAAAAQLLVWK